MKEYNFEEMSFGEMCNTIQSLSMQVKRLQDSKQKLAEMLTPDVKKRIIDLLLDNKKVDAIKLYRDVYDEGLRESKQAVDAIALELYEKFNTMTEPNRRTNR
jgi:ribosomal protein L7/L12